jgi:ferritin-like metal-binding protein YciE
MKTLRNLFLNELADIYDAEKRLVLALPRLEKAAASNTLRRALRKHVKETLGHVRKIERVFQHMGVNAKSRPCEATIGLLREADEIVGEFRGSPAIDAAVISAAQKIKHYQIASYGCLREWSEVLGHKPATDILLELLGRERAADETLTGLARDRSNNQARGEDGADPTRGTANREGIAAR